MERCDREFEGRDLQEALRAAADKLGIAEPELDYKILEQGRRGLFGLGAKAVRIRVMPPVEAVAEAAPAPAGSPAPQPQEPAPQPRAAGGAAVQAAVRQMVGLMGLELNVAARETDAGIAVELGGADRKLLLQKDGELIAALQFLLNRMARRAFPGVGRIHLSCDGDRKQRDGELVELTREAARQVARTGKTARLHPMNAYERRLVHITVREFPELDSRSEGNGFLKRVRVFRRK